MSSCNEIVKCIKTGNICLKPTLVGSSLCQYHKVLYNIASPIVHGKCKWVRKNYKRCDNTICLICNNGYCDSHQADTISYRHNCGQDSICGCIPPEHSIHFH
jgi:hypothetical protein